MTRELAVAKVLVVEVRLPAVTKVLRHALVIRLSSALKVVRCLFSVVCLSCQG